MRGVVAAAKDGGGGLLLDGNKGEEIKVGTLATRFLVEGEESGGSIAVFAFDVPADANVAGAHSHDGYEETIYSLEGRPDLLTEALG